MDADGAAVKQVPGFIGLGNIGLPMAQRIAARFPLQVWNRTAAKADALLAVGAGRAASPADLASRSDVIILCVDSPATIEALLFGAEGIATAAPCRASLIVDASTMPPAFTRDVAGRLLAQTRIGWIDAPVSGGTYGAAAGTLACFAGGDPRAIDAAEPFIAAYAATITRMGDIGAGQATKACNQILNFAAAAAIAEAIVIGERFGLDVARLPAALAGGMADSHILQHWRPESVEGINRFIGNLADFYQGRIDPKTRGHFSILLKDLGSIFEIARAGGAPAPIMRHVEMIANILHHQATTSGDLG